MKKIKHNCYRLLGTCQTFCSAFSDASHQLMIAWRAAKFTVPSLIAHESALQCGDLLEIPYFGDALE